MFRMIKLDNYFYFLFALIFVGESRGLASCHTQSLFDREGVYQGCLVIQKNTSLYQDSKLMAQTSCGTFCNLEGVNQGLRPTHSAQKGEAESSDQIQQVFSKESEKSCAVKALKKGNSRFVQFEMSRPKMTLERRRELAKGQRPNAIIVSCSDSRVPPELVLDQGIGDLFVIRTAGHVLGSSAVASIEYAYQNLGAKTIIVMGHESCGAVKATLASTQGSSVGSPSLDKMIETIRPHVQDFNDNAEVDPLLEKPVKAHTEGTIRALMKRSEIIRKAVETKKLEVLAAFASITSGEVTFWEVEITPEKKLKKSPRR